MLMPKEKKKREGGPMPVTGAGLVRFFEEDTQGIKIRPEIIVVMSVSLVGIVLIARILAHI